MASQSLPTSAAAAASSHSNGVHTPKRQTQAQEPCPTTVDGTTGLLGLSALWPDCRQFLRNVALGRECRTMFNLEPNAVFLNHNAFGTAVKPGTNR